MKNLALYLPQYHTISENDKWWGKDFTEWTTVKNGKKFFKAHQQPKVPLNDNYYDLVTNGCNTWQWQANLANKYGIYGFCIYHYWFNGKLLLEKPMEILLANPQIDVKYSICWANEPWARTWDGKPTNVLMNQVYGGDDDIISHFNYLLQFFKDPRYIKINNKPMVNLYRTVNIAYLEQMISMWNCLAKENGFDGIYWVSAITSEKNDERTHLFDHYYYFEPGYTLHNALPKYYRLRYVFISGLRRIANRVLNTNLVERIVDINIIWTSIEGRIIRDKVSPGIVVSWDNTPRKKKNGHVFENSTPFRFGQCISVLNSKYPKDEFLYINAWNEWSEGAYLEPDKIHKFEYLEAIHQVSQ